MLCRLRGHHPCLLESRPQARSLAGLVGSLPGRPQARPVRNGSGKSWGTQELEGGLPPRKGCWAGWSLLCVMRALAVWHAPPSLSFPVCKVGGHGQLQPRHYPCPDPTRRFWMESADVGSDSTRLLLCLPLCQLDGPTQDMCSPEPRGPHLPRGESHVPLTALLWPRNENQVRERRQSWGAVG